MNPIEPAYSLEPQYIGGSRGCFTVSFKPRLTPSGTILYIPPFCEEMNRCRAAVAEQARWFATSGYACTVLDFFGTGESPGILADAAFEDWIDNISTAATAALNGGNAPLSLWACRTGALLALAALEAENLAVDRLLLWQPVPSGKAFVKQLVRQKIAGRIGHGESSESTSSIRESLARGVPLEVAGYRVGSSLLLQLESMTIDAFTLPSGLRVDWLEHKQNSEQPLGVASQRAIDALGNAGSAVRLHRFSGPPIWQLHERDECADLLRCTREAWLL